MYGLKTIHDDFIHLHQSYTYSVILLQIVMVSPGTHLVKIMSPSPEPLSPNWKNSKSKTDSKTLYYNLLE